MDKLIICFPLSVFSITEAFFALYCFVGNLCSAVGAFLSKQFDFQVRNCAQFAEL